jgi:mannose-6-phosphate isomerase-like protein (cupin superfamily)
MAFIITMKVFSAPAEKCIMTKPDIIRNRSDSEYYFEERCFITEWWNSPCDKEVSVAKARVEPGITTRLHRLKDVTERYIIIEGKGIVEVGELAPTEFGLGDVVLIPPRTPQKITNIGDSDLIFLAICTPRFSQDVYEDIDSDGV